MEVKLNNQRWQLWAGRTMVKDFADGRDQAYEARRLIADMKLTERTVIGRSGFGPGNRRLPVGRLRFQ